MRLKPGRELDYLIYRHVFHDFPVGDTEPFLEAAAIRADSFPHYSTDIAAAWAVVEKIKQLKPHKHDGNSKPYWLIMSDQYHKIWRAGYEDNWPDCFDYSEAETAPHAICLAALKAVGHKFED